MLKKFIPVLLALSLAGCIKAHKVDIEQGNIITPDMVSKLKTGMTQAQVEFIMGHPILVETFNEHRWDYVYTFRSEGKDRTYKRLTLHFEGDTLSGMDSTGIPPSAPHTDADLARLSATVDTNKKPVPPLNTPDNTSVKGMEAPATPNNPTDNY